MQKSQPKAVILAPYLGINSDVTQQILSGQTSAASDKFQVKPILETLRTLRYEAKAISLNTTFRICEINMLNNPDICFISKLRGNENEDKNIYAMFHQSCVLNLKRKGVKIVTLYSDHLAIEDSEDGELYKNILYLSDAIISPTSNLIVNAQKWSLPNTFKTIIRDPCFVPERTFKQLYSAETCKVLWFGNNSNIPYLLSALPALLHNPPKERKFQLTFLTTNEAIKQVKNFMQSINISSRWSFRFVEWKYSNQPNQLINELDSAHITFIPSDPNDPRKSGVSHNRLTDSIQSGCIAVASPMESYLELAKISLIGNNLHQLFHKAVLENERLCKKYSSLRSGYLKDFHPQKNREDWAKAIKSIQANTQY